MRTPTPKELAELERLYGIMSEYEGYLLPIGRHNDLRQYIYKNFGVLELDREKMKALARRLIDMATGAVEKSQAEADAEFVSRYEDEI